VCTLSNFPDISGLFELLGAEEVQISGNNFFDLFFNRKSRKIGGNFPNQISEGGDFNLTSEVSNPAPESREI
jgi:hypothetical protein